MVAERNMDSLNVAGTEPTVSLAIYYAVGRALTESKKEINVMSRLKKYFEECKTVEKGLEEHVIAEAKAYIEEAEAVKGVTTEAFKAKRMVIDDMRMEASEMRREAEDFRNSGNSEAGSGEQQEGREQPDPTKRPEGNSGSGT